jgi:deazaflavin-dependent oxidoreductase (nitroreductase family)
MVMRTGSRDRTEWIELMARDWKKTLAGAPNEAVGWVIGRLGRSPGGAQLLEVRGRKSGQVRSTPVNPIEVDGRRYLLSPRGETQWVRNFRAAGEATLRVGGRRDSIVLVRELSDAEKPAVLRAYLDRWAWQVKGLIDAPKGATDDQLAAIAGNHAVFEIRPA